MRIDQIPTPALLVDLDAMESNLHRMADFFRDRPCKLRPHFKNHKTPLLALKQVRSGAIGMSCATMREAEILVSHGIESILIANEIAGETKIDKLAELSRHASVMVAIDNRNATRDLARARRNSKTQIEVLVDINIGLNRCGLESKEAALELAKFAAGEGLKVRGVMGYDGHLQGVPQSAERDETIRRGSKMLVEAAAMLDQAGIHAPIVSTGGTGTHAVSGAFPGITEIQAGSYLLMDTIYLGRGAPFQRSLTILATVVSARPERAILDCGVKAMSSERGLPILKDFPETQLSALHAEHTLVDIDPVSGVRFEPGQKVEIWVHYSDATLNLHSRFYGVRNGQVEEIYRIEH